jgi:pSer/pThr/pTyr-binding forkhead associated (FHA) protein
VTPSAAAGPAPGVVPAPEAVVPHITLEVTAGNAVGTVIDVADELLIGRMADGVGALADDVEISRRHARIFRTDGGRYAVEDLVSTNGTYVNGLRIVTVTPLEVGDWMDVGATTLVVRVSVPGPVVPVPEEEPAEHTIAPPPVSRPDVPATEPLEPAPAAVQEPAPAPAPEAVELQIETGADVGPLKLTLRLEIDLAAAEIAIRFDDDCDPITVVHRDGRWRAKPPD